ncbi:tRNA A37 threonylcarbamoyltransferase TsaD [Tardiphaga robiniae]|uniref:hypothetical protein n=1 Tax=Tardiphaga robiniae TaxID=943830 RepID=UPI00285BDC4B|nr:hypothetical protein [Tardiphaga robiniae]MDR6661940.1 tRNA A37 threonylcarbamoyltransferase TsaD [Tardiphaga robiniae]
MSNAKPRPTEVIFEGLGTTLDEALSAAHDQIAGRTGFDFAISKVVEWGMQRGGITGQRLIWVKVVQDKSAGFKT